MSREAFEAWALRNTSLPSAHEMAWAAWQAALAQQQAEPVRYEYQGRDGWVMVPREPTTHAISRGVVALYESIKKDFEASGSGVAAVYRAMIAAAPAVPDPNLVESHPIRTAPAVQPLTDEQIDEMCGEANRGFCIERDDYRKAARDTEQAHGIAAPGSKP